MTDYTELIAKCEELLEIINRLNRSDLNKFISDAADAIERLQRERDAAIADLKEDASCDYCKHANPECKEYWNIGEMGLSNLCHGDNWEWRGLHD